jgi:hypothetical protein
MITPASQNPKAVIPAQAEISSPMLSSTSKIPACAGMTADYESHSLVYRSARKDAMLRGEKGGSLIEFAIIAPLLFVILFGIIEFGVLLYDKAMLTNAVREGARAGIVFAKPRLTDGEIIAIVKNYCESHLISFGVEPVLSISGKDGAGIMPETPESGDSITVEATYGFRFLVFSNLLALLGGDNQDGGIDLSAVSVMRLE